MSKHLIELGQRLADYRRRCDPAEYGIRVNGVRRTRGLRREEVAERLFLSTDLISKLERGKYPSVSVRLLSELSDFYQLDHAKRSDLFNLARLYEETLPVVIEQNVPQSIQDFVDHQGEYPTFVINRRWDVIAWNESLNLILGDMGALPKEMRNILWILFGGPMAKELIVDWERHAKRVLGQFRLDFGRARGDLNFTQLVEELSAVSPEFAEWWVGPLDIRAKQTVYKQIRHPALGLLDFQQMGFRLEDNPNLLVGVYFPSTPETAVLLRRCFEEFQRSLVVTEADFPQVAELLRSQGD